MLFDQNAYIIRNQLSQGIVKRIPNGQPNKREFCLPHRLVIREMEEITTVQKVLDALARENNYCYCYYY